MQSAMIRIIGIINTLRMNASLSRYTLYSLSLCYLDTDNRPPVSLFVSQLIVVFLLPLQFL